MKTKKSILMLLLVLTACIVGTAVFPQSAEAAKKKPYTIKGKTITVKAKNKADITEALDEALTVARDKASSKKKYTVVVPKGTYKINSRGLHIYSNTTLDLSKGVTLKYSSKEPHPMLSTGTNGSYKGKSDYNASSKCKGYQGFSNITIKGGKFVNSKKNTSSTMRLFHGKNITLKGVTFSGGGGVHQLEVAALNKFYVKNCTFKDYGITNKKTSRKYEALQMDIPCSDKVYPDVYQDGTVMKDVEITGCTFSNVPRGVGSHTLLNGAYYTDIKINGNTFKNIPEEAIVGLNYRNCEIKDNVVQNCGGGILFQYFKAANSIPSSVSTTIFDGKKQYKGTIQHDANTVISGNKITTKFYKNCDEIQGIKVYGFNLTATKKGRDGKIVPKNNYYVSDVTVENNTITTAGYGIHMMDTQNCAVRNNTITGAGFAKDDPQKTKIGYPYDGILVENEAKNVSVTGNAITGMKRHGVFVQVKAQVSSIEKNTISRVDGSGIYFYNQSNTPLVSGNSITNCNENGIMLNSQCTVGTIENNTVTCQNASGSGIYLYKNSKVTGSITGNVLSGTKRAGIMLDSSTVQKDVKNNTISNTGRGVYRWNKGTILGGISGNKYKNVPAMCE